MKITINNIKKSYNRGKKEVLKDVTLVAESGQCVGILGTNGCGKTTLLSVLAGTVRADFGEFAVDGVDLLKNVGLVQKYVGYVPQNNALIEELSAKDNLRLWYSSAVLDLEKELEDGVLRMLGINEFLNVTVAKLSGGMKKRLSIGCALANAPKILILDEPGAGLDILCRDEIDSYLKFFLENGGIIFLTSHEEREIKLCDKTFIISEGVLEECNYEGMDMLLSKLRG